MRRGGGTYLLRIPGRQDTQSSSSYSVQAGGVLDFDDVSPRSPADTHAGREIFADHTRERFSLCLRHPFVLVAVQTQGDKNRLLPF
jgi:hypothetical protein